MILGRKLATEKVVQAYEPLPTAPLNTLEHYLVRTISVILLDRIKFHPVLIPLQTEVQ